MRTVLRSAGEAAAPLAFGYVSQYIFGPGSSAAVGGGSGGQAGNPAGLEYTFLVFLVPLIAAGRLALAALRTGRSTLKWPHCSPLSWPHQE